jgi:hypothetical protein
MTDPQREPVPNRFTGIVSLVSSLVFGILAMSVWLMVVMLAGTALVPLLRPDRRTRRQVILSAIAGGLVGVLGVYLMRSRGLTIG